MLSQERLDELWDFTDPSRSESRLRDALHEPGATPQDRAELETQVARALGLQSRFEDADRVLDGIVFDSMPVTVRVLLERGRIRNSAGHPTDAITYFTSARSTASRAELRFLEVDALHMLAIADRDNAAHWTTVALELLDHTDDTRTHRWAVALHNNLGWHLHDDGSYDDALTQFSLAQGAAIRFGTTDQRFHSRWAYARCLRSLGRLDEAREIQRELAEARPRDAEVEAELAELRT